MNTIHVTPAGAATPDPAKARIVAEVERRKVSLAHPLVLRKIMLNPVPKGKTYE